MYQTTARILEVNPGRAGQKKRRRVALCWAGNNATKSAIIPEIPPRPRNTPSARSDLHFIIVA